MRQQVKGYIEMASLVVIASSPMSRDESALVSMVDADGVVMVWLDVMSEWGEHELSLTTENEWRWNDEAALVGEWKGYDEEKGQDVWVVRGYTHEEATARLAGMMTRVVVYYGDDMVAQYDDEGNNMAVVYA
jgi:hypothetical protein